MRLNELKNKDFDLYIQKNWRRELTSTPFERELPSESVPEIIWISYLDFKFSIRPPALRNVGTDFCGTAVTLISTQPTTPGKFHHHYVFFYVNPAALDKG